MALSIKNPEADRQPPPRHRKFGTEQGKQVLMAREIFRYWGLPALFMFFASGMSGQTSSCRTVFEVASVHLHRPDKLDQIPLAGPMVDAMRVQGGPGTSAPGSIRYRGVTLKMLASRAYGIRPEQITGPSWVGSDQYDISANVPPGSTKEDLSCMLRDLLASRFHLESHIEKKTLAVYGLTVAPDGPKLVPSPGPQKLSPEEVRTKVEEMQRQQMARNRESTAQILAGKRPRNFRSFGMPNATLEEFAARLSSELDLPVTNETGLDGRWQFNLEWVPERVAGSGPPPEDDTSNGESIFGAVEKQFGLRLHRHKQSIDVLVVDKADRTPVEN